jgi:VWFA-related protein
MLTGPWPNGLNIQQGAQGIKRTAGAYLDNYTMRLRQLSDALAVLVLVGNLAGLPGGPEARGQDQAQSQKPLRVQTSVVNLFATVRDGHHALMPGLAKEDFKIFEDGQDQKVAFFSKEVNMPITMGMLIDTSGSQQDVLGAEQEAASRFVHHVLRKDDEAMVLSFDVDVDLLADFTQDTGLLERAIRRTVINAPGSAVNTGPVALPPGGTNLYDAIYLACHDRLATEAGRKAVVILTDAEDTGSKLKLQDAIEAAQRADTVIHILLLSDEAFYFHAGMGYGGAGVAKKLAEETGGRVIEVRSEKDLEKAFDVLSEELRTQYVLGYYPSNATHDGGFRKIKVETTRSGLKVLARRGYYAPKN